MSDEQVQQIEIISEKPADVDSSQYNRTKEETRRVKQMQKLKEKQAQKKSHVGSSVSWDHLMKELDDEDTE